MKLFGEKLQEPNEEVLVIPRGNGKDIVIKARAVIDMKPFQLLCPLPVAPIVRTKDGSKADATDPDFVKEVGEYSSKRSAWMTIVSLKAWEGMEWERVKEDDPNTWLLWSDELAEAGFSDMERSRIVNLVMAANCLSEARMEEARAYFLASKEVPQDK